MLLGNWWNLEQLFWVILLIGNSFCRLCGCLSAVCIVSECEVLHLASPPLWLFPQFPPLRIIFVSKQTKECAKMEKGRKKDRDDGFNLSTLATNNLIWFFSRLKATQGSSKHANQLNVNLITYKDMAWSVNCLGLVVIKRQFATGGPFFNSRPYIRFSSSL